MSRQMRRAAERAGRKNTPPLIGPSGHRMQEAATAWQTTNQQVGVAEAMVVQYDRLKKEMEDEEVEHLIELLPGLEEKLKQRLQIARVAVIDAGIALIGLPQERQLIEKPTDEDVANIDEKLAQIAAEEARG